MLGVDPKFGIVEPPRSVAEVAIVFMLLDVGRGRMRERVFD